MAVAKVYSVIDLTHGFFHVNVAEEQKCLLFVTPWAQYIPKKAMFGYCDSTASFLELIDFIFRELARKGIIAKYMNDLGFKTENEEQVVECLEMVLDLAASFGIKVNWKKCQLIQRQIEFLRNNIKNDTISPLPSKTEALTSYLVPNTPKLFVISDRPAIFASLFAIIH